MVASGTILRNGLPLENLLAVIGIVILAVLVIRRGLNSGTAMIAVVIGASTLITIMGMQVDWARYHWPILLAMAICSGVAAGTAGSRILSRR